MSRGGGGGSGRGDGSGAGPRSTSCHVKPAARTMRDASSPAAARSPSNKLSSLANTAASLSTCSISAVVVTDRAASRVAWSASAHGGLRRAGRAEHNPPHARRAAHDAGRATRRTEDRSPQKCSQRGTGPGARVENSVMLIARMAPINRDQIIDRRRRGRGSRATGLDARPDLLDARHISAASMVGERALRHQCTRICRYTYD